MLDYPFSTPQILSDSLFIEYGGETGTSTAGQRRAAYFIAESQVSSHINTLLVQTTVTGTYQNLYNPIITDYGHVNEIIGVNLLESDCSCNLSAIPGCAMIRDNRFGYIDVLVASRACGCLATNQLYSIQVVYNAGFPSGTVLRPDMLLALTMAAQINLNEIDNHTLHNEGSFDIGVQTFRTMDYMEERVKLGRTNFGTSAAAQKIKNLLHPYVCRSGLRFR